MPLLLDASRLAARRTIAQASARSRDQARRARARARAAEMGLTGAKLALPTEDGAEVTRRFAAIQEELAPETVVGAHLAHQVALMTVRCQRAARHESAALTARVRRAGADFDRARVDRAARLFGRIGAEPARARDRLLATPEGVDRLIGGLDGLRTQLDGDEITWHFQDTGRVAALLGQPAGDGPPPRAFALAKVVEGDDSLVPWGVAAAVPNLDGEEARLLWAAAELVAAIDAEVAHLRAHRDGLDHGAIARARAEAEDLALFDPGKEAQQARRYEAESSRSLHRALREFRLVEGEAEARAIEDELTAASAEAADADHEAEILSSSPGRDDQTPGAGELGAGLGSFFPGASPKPVAAGPVVLQGVGRAPAAPRGAAGARRPALGDRPRG